MKKYKLVSASVLLLFLYKVSISQDRQYANISETITKIRSIQKEYRVIEKTFSDVVVAGDTAIIVRNRYWDYNFSASNRYHINAFGSILDFTDINLYVYRIDENDKLQLVTRDGIFSNDISINFTPAKSGVYYIIITGTLKANVASGYFNVIIDRD